MDNPKNPLRHAAHIWAGIIVVGIIIIFIPSLIGMDGFNGGFALSFGGIAVVIFGIVGTLIYVRLAARLDKIFKKENQLAHWTYSHEEWKLYSEKEHAEEAVSKKGLFFVISILTLIVGIVLYAIVGHDFWVIFSTVLVIILIVGLSAFFSTRSTYRLNKKYLGEAYISQDGVYLNRRAHIWKGIGSCLENVVYEEGKQPQPRIEFKYSMPSRFGRDCFTVRVPVPRGQEGAAKKIAKEIDAAHLKNILE